MIGRKEQSCRWPNCERYDLVQAEHELAERVDDWGLERLHPDKCLVGTEGQTSIDGALNDPVHRDL